jgi:membrane protease YdiL (CAAX protease family)
MNEERFPVREPNRSCDKRNDLEPGRRRIRLPGPGTTHPPQSISFTPRAGTWILLIFLVVVWPALGLTLMIFGGSDMSLDIADPVNFIILPTIIIQWLIFGAVVLGVIREKSTFASIGLVRPKLSDIPKAIVFLIAANITLTALQFILSAAGLTVSEDVDKLVQNVRESVGWWLAISITAAVCEEVAFRGYIITRIRGLFPRAGWIPAVLLSAMAFAAGHGYQGVAGLILLFTYGLMFCGLYLYTGSLWPAIIAHFIQDFSAIFIYDYVEF